MKTPEERLAICKKCPLYKEHPFNGPICDSTKYINANDGITISYRSKPGFVKGCGCRLKFKTNRSGSHCIVNKW